MTIAHANIEQKVAEAVSQPTNAVRVTRIMLIANTPSLGQAMQQEMVQDANVSGTLRQGTLASALADHTNDCIDTDFVVFELSDVETDLLAIARLKVQAPHNVQCIAVSQSQIEPATSARLLSHGVTEVMTLRTASTEVVTVPVNPTLQTAGQVIVVLRARGGAGATTLAVNLAVAQAASATTALIDLDIQNGAVALALDLPDSHEATNFIKGDTVADAAFLDRAMHRHSSGLDVLTAPDVFAPLSAITPAMISQLIDALRARYDHVVIDMPQAVVEWIAPVLERTSKVVLVSDMTLPSLKRSKRLLDLISDEHMTLPVSVLINFEKRPMFKTAAHKEAALLIGQPLDHWIPLDAASARRATDMGIPLVSGAKRAPISKAICAFGTSIFKTSSQE